MAEMISSVFATFTKSTPYDENGIEIVILSPLSSYVAPVKNPLVTAPHIAASQSISGKYFIPNRSDGK